MIPSSWKGVRGGEEMLAMRWNAVRETKRSRKERAMRKMCGHTALPAL